MKVQHSINALALLAALALPVSPQPVAARMRYLTLPTLLQYCAPAVAPKTMTALISVESGGWPWDIDDNTTGHSYHPADFPSAYRIASDLYARGHQLDVGLAQVDTENFAAYHLSLAAAFDPCANVSVGSMILAKAYRFAHHLYGNPQTALYHALEMYNSGRANGAPHYAYAVWSAAQ